MLPLPHNIFIGRRANGGIRLLKFATSPAYPPKAEGVYRDWETCLFDLTISKEDWVRTMVAVSHHPADASQWYAAMELHMGHRGDP